MPRGPWVSKLLLVKRFLPWCIYKVILHSILTQKYKQRTIICTRNASSFTIVSVCSAWILEQNCPAWRYEIYRLMTLNSSRSGWPTGNWKDHFHSWIYKFLKRLLFSKKIIQRMNFKYFMSVIISTKCNKNVYIQHLFPRIWSYLTEMLYQLAKQF